MVYFTLPLGKGDTFPVEFVWLVCTFATTPNTYFANSGSSCISIFTTLSPTRNRKLVIFLVDVSEMDNFDGICTTEKEEMDFFNGLDERGSCCSSMEFEDDELPLRVRYIFEQDRNNKNSWCRDCTALDNLVAQGKLAKVVVKVMVNVLSHDNGVHWCVPWQQFFDVVKYRDQPPWVAALNFAHHEMSAIHRAIPINVVPNPRAPPNQTLFARGVGKVEVFYHPEHFEYKWQEEDLYSEPIKPEKC